MENELTPTPAYSLLTDAERDAVDNYMGFILKEQKRINERIALALYKPIPQQFIKQSRGALAKPIPRAALAERIKEEADAQDLNPDRIIDEYKTIAFASMGDYFETGAFGESMLKDWKTITEDKLRAIKAVKVKPTMNGMQTELVLHDKKEALAILTKLTGLVAPDRPPLLERYVTDAKEQEALDAPSDVYAQLLEE